MKKLVCLANSRKSSGRCLAGVEIDEKSRLRGWIRPVSARDTQELSEEERRYENGTDPRVLDVLEVHLLKELPHGHQSENHVVDTDYYFVKRGTATWDQLQAAVETTAKSLWENGDSSTYGLNDRMSKAAAAKFKSSLMLIKPENLKILVRIEGARFNNPRRRVRASFEWKRDKYILSVTDPVAERRYLQMDDGEYHLADALICVSVGEPWDDGNCYKFCATIITKRDAGT